MRKCFFLLLVSSQAQRETEIKYKWLSSLQFYGHAWQSKEIRAKIAYDAGFFYTWSTQKIFLYLLFWDGRWLLTVYTSCHCEFTSICFIFFRNTSIKTPFFPMHHSIALPAPAWAVCHGLIDGHKKKQPRQEKRARSFRSFARPFLLPQTPLDLFPFGPGREEKAGERTKQFIAFSSRMLCLPVQ